MMSTNNILSPASGRPIINPTQDIVLGLYYMTRERRTAKGASAQSTLKVTADGKLDGIVAGVYGSLEEVRAAYDHGMVSLHAAIKCRIKDRDDLGKERSQIIGTTVGRVLLSEILPPGVPFDYVNRVLNKKALSELIDVCYRKHKNKETVLMADRLEKLEHAIILGRRARAIVRQNIGFALGLIGILIAGTLSGHITLPMGVLGHEGSTVIVTLSGLRLLRN